MPVIFTIQALVILFLYFLLIAAFLIGWIKTKRYQPDRQAPSTRVSILIPCRNEATNIHELASLLNNQDYPAGLLEIIWIDDHSTDNSHLIICDLINPHNNHNPHNLLVTSNDLQYGKKAALKAGMASATGELILLTDADSRPGIQWVSTMVRFFEESGSDLILGPVMLGPATNGFDQIQQLEYLSLVASSIGAAGIGQPVMAQGPNLAVRATDYREMVNDLNNRFISGDDVFLLQSMKQMPGKKIHYLLNPDAIVHSKPAESISGFIRQRSRWASKATGYRNPLMILTTVLVFTANLEILAAWACALIGLVPVSLALLLLGIKTLADLPLLFNAMRFFGCTNLLWWFIPVQILYPVYISITGIVSQWVPVNWKIKGS